MRRPASPSVSASSPTPDSQSPSPMWTRPLPAQASGDQGVSNRRPAWPHQRLVGGTLEKLASWPDWEHRIETRAPMKPRISATRRAGKRRTTAITSRLDTPAAASASAASVTTTSG